VGAEREYDPDRPYDPMMTRALREVVARCLYGADINEMAVEMCKLSLWLISLDPARPFSFLDDKVMLGNSLLGLTSVDQLRRRHIFPESKPAAMGEGLFDDVYSPIETAIKLRKEIASSPVDDSDVHRSAAHKSNLLRQANEATNHLREIADAIVAAGLPSGGKPGKKLDEAYAALEFAINQAFGKSQNRTALDRILELGLKPEVKTDYEKWKPLHWILEAPQVMEVGGFDAVIGNPPFLVSAKLLGAVGANMREWMANVVAKSSGAADLISYFFRRAASVVNESGTIGLIGAKAISEGDSLRVGLTPLLQKDWSAYRVDKNRPWPVRGVSTSISTIWMARQQVGKALLDGEIVESISENLTSSGLGLIQPQKFRRSKFAYEGSHFLGDGFLLDENKALEILSQSPEESEVLHPFLNAQDLNSSPFRKGTKWIIDMDARGKKEAKVFTLSWEILETFVKPERQKLDAKKYPKRVEFWWQHASASAEMKRRLSKIDFAIVIPRTSKYMIPAVVDANQVFGKALAVIPANDFALFAVLSSWVHRSWVEWWSAGMDTRFRYSISDGADTFPFPRKIDGLEKLGKKLHLLQIEIAKKQDLGSTKIYSLVNSDTDDVSSDIQALRDLHRQIDVQLLKNFDSELELGPYESSEFKYVVQWGPPASQRIEILQLLLAENQRQQVEGVIEWPAK
jgi:hypothetical protein